MTSSNITVPKLSRMMEERNPQPIRYDSCSATIK
jgi:hypothetical protein